MSLADLYRAEHERNKKQRAEDKKEGLIFLGEMGGFLLGVIGILMFVLALGILGGAI